jgi:hypothetical protein
MKTTSTYKTKILYYNEIFSQTLSVYNEAVSYLIDVVYQNRADIFALNGKKQNNYLERLCIKTKKNPDPPYDFSKRFYKFPSYYRRAAMQFALGHVQSYLTKLYAWAKAGTIKISPVFRQSTGRSLFCTTHKVLNGWMITPFKLRYCIKTTGYG